MQLLPDAPAASNECSGVNTLLVIVQHNAKTGIFRLKRLANGVWLKIAVPLYKWKRLGNDKWNRQ